jgi:hypothetical protein
MDVAALRGHVFGMSFAAQGRNARIQDASAIRRGLRQPVSLRIDRPENFQLAKFSCGSGRSGQLVNSFGRNWKSTQPRHSPGAMG